MARLKGKVALITGGASGMGAGAARVMAREGCRLVLADLNASLLGELCTELGSDVATGQVCDITDQTQVAGLVEHAIERFGRIDILFNNAGIAGIGSVATTEPGDWRRVIDVDLSAVYYVSRLVIPHMLAKGGGAIIDNASVSGMFGDYGMASYSAAKGGVVNLTRNMALDLAQSCIRVNCICPGAIDTPLFQGIKDMPELFRGFEQAIPMKRLGMTSEIGEAVAFLASDAASYITGLIMPVDGGLTCRTGWPNIADYMPS